MSNDSRSLLDVAEAVDALLRRFDARDFFREQAHSAAGEHLALVEEAERRRERRREATAKTGVCYGRQKLDNEEAVRKYGLECFDWQETFGGRIQLPQELLWASASPMLPIFELAKKRGFPNDARGNFKYKFHVVAWLPDKLGDLPVDGPLPVPKRQVTLLGKYVAMAAVYDAHWPGAEMIAPWGTQEVEGREEPVNLLWADHDSRGAAQWYLDQVIRAEGLSADDARAVASWAADVEKDLAEAFPGVASPELAVDVGEIFDRLAAYSESSPVKPATARKKRKRKPDSKQEKKLQERKARQAREDAILSDWDGDNWESYGDYTRWKNEHLPEGWSSLSAKDVARAVENVKRRARRRKK